MIFGYWIFAIIIYRMSLYTTGLQNYANQYQAATAIDTA